MNKKQIYCILILIILLILHLITYNIDHFNDKLTYIKESKNIYKFTGIIPNNNNETRFIIIVTFYNPGINLLKRCLDSIAVQKYKNYDVCLVNDYSNKEVSQTENLLKEYKKNINGNLLTLIKIMAQCTLD